MFNAIYIVRGWVGIIKEDEEVMILGLSRGPREKVWGGDCLV